MPHPTDRLPDHIVIEGRDPVLPARCPIGEVAARALAAVGDAARQLSLLAGGDPGVVSTSVEKGAQSIISFAITKVDGETIPRTNQSNPFVRAYRCGDGRWIQLHGGFPHLVARLAEVLGIEADAGFDEVAAAVENWDAQQLEDAVAAVDGCAGVVRTEEEWRAHPHGAPLSTLPPVAESVVGGPIPGWEPSARRPLAGLRVLDLTRVLAGPTCGRTLAALGADVLQVTGPATPNVPSFVIDTGQGKRRAVADLSVPSDLAAVQQLAAGAHVIVQGYRPGVVERFGLDAATVRDRGFAGIYGTVSAFGAPPLPDGRPAPFTNRAGWEQLAQAVSGIAALEGGMTGDVLVDSEAGNRPRLLPAAATDYTTGYLLAAEITRRLGLDEACDLHASLCQTAAVILDAEPRCDPEEATGIGVPETDTVVSGFGRVERLGPNVTVEGLDIGWRGGPMALGSSLLTWKGWSNW